MPPALVEASQLLALARTQIGKSYRFGVLTPKDAVDPPAFDCAEFGAWLVYRTSHQLFGCADNTAPPAEANAYTGYWDRDSVSCRVSVDIAMRTVGAFLLRAPEENIGGHLALSDGNYRTVEAHSTAKGVCSLSARDRRWTCGILVPGYHYAAPRASTRTTVGPPVSSRRLLRLTRPHIQGEDVRWVQRTVRVEVDGDFGPQTAHAVVAWQAAHGLTPDGEVGPATWAAIEATG